MVSSGFLWCKELINYRRLIVARARVCDTGQSGRGRGAGGLQPSSNFQYEDFFVLFKIRPAKEKVKTQELNGSVPSQNPFRWHCMKMGAGVRAQGVGQIIMWLLNFLCIQAMTCLEDSMQWFSQDWVGLWMTLH